MEINTTSLLPYVLDLLSRQPDLCTTVDALCAKIKDVVMDDVISPFGTLKRAVEFSVELGSNLGLLLLSDKRIRMPFNLRTKKDVAACQQVDEQALAEGHERSVVKRLAKTLKDPRNGVRKPKTSVKKRRKFNYKQPVARPKNKKCKLTKKQLIRQACRARGNY
ncbi:hypothetical protein AWZ03_007755 [Drosophila navojoa]|uniref:Uncharacterized protein n=1 Tax=Drosophila navojoa TaxID=7232 RepID=A0A484BCR3_DRONA|nr:uncharacterized protein LOC108649397 [Drosophila navojoa]TDG45800.1 hypothetical protein AWZ03_007755 [Drosophila navojoa]